MINRNSIRKLSTGDEYEYILILYAFSNGSSCSFVCTLANLVTYPPVPMIGNCDNVYLCVNHMPVFKNKCKG